MIHSLRKPRRDKPFYFGKKDCTLYHDNILKLYDKSTPIYTVVEETNTFR